MLTKVGVILFVIFADDSKQKSSRIHMEGHSFTCVGGFAVDGDKLRDLESALDACCVNAGFPPGEEFKWSPDSKNWIYKGLVGAAREKFFIDVLSKAKEFGAVAFVAAEDRKFLPAFAGMKSDRDVMELFLERISNFLTKSNSTGFVIADAPGGGAAGEKQFLLECMETRAKAGPFVKHDKLSLSVVCAKSDLVRCLQLADLIASCTLARVVGSKYAGPVFPHIRSLLHNDANRCGGIGLKLHPDLKYANLYHWILGDKQILRKGNSYPLPSKAEGLFAETEDK